jgi:hypothetical protein
VNVTEIVQLAPAATLLPHVFVWLNSAALAPPMTMLVIDNVPEPPFESVMVCGPLVVFTFWFPNETLEGVSETCATPAPLPLRGAVWGEPVALSETEINAERAPTACGVNVTVIVQLAPAATLVPHVFVWPKSPALLPVTVIPPIERGPEPPLVSVIVFGGLVVLTFWSANDKVEGLKATWATPVPVPLRAAVWGEPAASSVTVSEADRDPAACGENVMEIVQLAPAATLVPQSLVWLNSAALVPTIKMLLIVSAPELAFESLIVWAVLVVLTSWLPNERLEGVNEICGPSTLVRVNLVESPPW